MRNAVWAEILKGRRTWLPWLSAGAFVIAPGVGALFMFILADPARAHALGLLGAKSELAGGTADWPSYLALLAQIVAVGGSVVFGIIVVWIFGREFSDRTVKDLLALPTARTVVVGAKFLVSGVWCLLLTAQTYLLGLAAGTLLALPGWSSGVAVHGLAVLAATAVMVVALVTPFALAASIGRGYLAAVGVILANVFIAQLAATLGYGQYYPWSVPALFSGIAGSRQPHPGPLGYALVLAVGIAGVTTTLYWWRTADQNR